MILLGIVMLFAFISLVSGARKVEQNHVLIVEQFGNFHRVARSGLRYVVPFLQASRKRTLQAEQLSDYYKNLVVTTKTKDNCLVDFVYDVQFKIDPSSEGIKNAVYELADPHQQMDTFVSRLLLNHLPDNTLDDIYENLPTIQQRATDELVEDMAKYGYVILKVMITKIKPAAGVIEAMNNINEQQRKLDSNKLQGDAEKVLAVKRAEAEAEVKRLNGVGIAAEREEIAKGWHESIKLMQKDTSLNDTEATFLLLFTNWTDMMKDVGTSENTTMVFMPSGPEGLSNFHSLMTNALLAKETVNS